jgi:hypothetical protein
VASTSSCKSGLVACLQVFRFKVNCLLKQSNKTQSNNSAPLRRVERHVAGYAHFRRDMASRKDEENMPSISVKEVDAITACLIGHVFAVVTRLAWMRELCIRLQWCARFRRPRTTRELKEE